MGSLEMETCGRLHPSAHLPISSILVGRWRCCHRDTRRWPRRAISGCCCLRAGQRDSNLKHRLSAWHDNDSSMRMFLEYFSFYSVCGRIIGRHLHENCSRIFSLLDCLLCGRTRYCAFVIQRLSIFAYLCLNLCHLCGALRGAGVTYHTVGRGAAHTSTQKGQDPMLYSRLHQSVTRSSRYGAWGTVLDIGACSRDRLTELPQVRRPVTISNLLHDDGVVRQTH
mmetsp:Transcript_7499/g.18325  ORF Transcript_7499/g.18325 Transcript_7499/m.18325 type:complete len:224 (+) Transcript_7499:231-902(+)